MGPMGPMSPMGPMGPTCAQWAPWAPPHRDEGCSAAQRAEVKRIAGIVQGQPRATARLLGCSRTRVLAVPPLLLTRVTGRKQRRPASKELAKTASGRQVPSQVDWYPCPTAVVAGSLGDDEVGM